MKIEKPEVKEQLHHEVFWLKALEAEVGLVELQAWEVEFQLVAQER